MAKSKVKVLEVTSHGGKRVVEHVELPKLPKGYGAYFTELAARRRAEQAAMLLDDIKNAPEDKKLLELAHGLGGYTQKLLNSMCFVEALLAGSTLRDVLVRRR